MKRITFAGICILVFTLKSLAQFYDVSIPSGNNFEVADFRFWLPKTDAKIKAILAIVPGYNYDGRDAIYGEVWQKFALENNLALMACFYKDNESSEIAYSEASKGSGQAMLDGIKEFAEKVKNKDLPDLPLILWGHSAGGQFNYEFACWKPEKVLTFVVNKGGFYETSIAPDETRKIPAIFFMGENDLYYRKDMIKGIYSVGRRLGAPWTLIEEKNTAHETNLSIPYGLKFFQRIIPKRLTGGNKLKDVSETKHKLAYWETKTLIKDIEIVDPDKLTVWLPDSNFAKSWEKLYK